MNTMLLLLLSPIPITAVFIVGVWWGRYGEHGHMMDDGTDLYKIRPTSENKDKLTVFRVTVHRCMGDGCSSKETRKVEVKNVHRDVFEDAIDELHSYDSYKNHPV